MCLSSAKEIWKIFKIYFKKKMVNVYILYEIFFNMKQEGWPSQNTKPCFILWLALCNYPYANWSNAKTFLVAKFILASMMTIGFLFN